jgi:ribonuclease HII
VASDLLSEKTIKELTDYFHALKQPFPNRLLEALDQDPRAGAQQLARTLRERKRKSQKEAKRLQRMLHYEKELWQKGFRFIAGVDEAGMAPLAGPVVAAAVILPIRYTLPGLDDSKKIPDENKRQTLARQIKRDAIAWAVGRAEVREIDRINIYHSGLLAMQRAVDGLSTQPDFVLVDARTIPHCAPPQRGIVHGDALSASIAAASILAKTTRDDHMIEMDRMYVGYGFASHKGYPTPDHLRVLRDRGPLPIHRRTFSPVRELLHLDPVQENLFE